MANFWETKTLAQMTPAEWESLCDGCGKCCLHKLEDDTDGEVYYTDVACRLLDLHSCQCSAYSTRLAHIPDCLNLTPAKTHELFWLPATCAYRLVAEGNPLYPWHPLLTGTPNSVHAAGASLRGRAVSELSIDEDDFQDRVVHWVDT